MTRKRSRQNDLKAKERAQAKRRREVLIMSSMVAVAVILIVYSMSTMISDADPTDPGEASGSGHTPQGGGLPTIIGSNPGNTAPDFSLTDVDGDPVSLSDHLGKVVVLDLMATWCGPCELEMEHLNEIYNDPAYSDVVIMSIDVDNSETVSQLRDFKASFGDDWIFAANGGSVGTAYKASSIPKLVIVDKEGIVAYSTVGVTPASTLKAQIDAVL